MAYDSVIIEHPQDWVLIFYIALSFILMLFLLILKRKDAYPNAICKLLGFIIIFTLGGIQYLILKFGLFPLYDFVGSMPKDNLFVRICALIFMLVYFYCLPFRRVK